MSDPFETLWTEILSRQEERIKAAFSRLSEEEQETVITHLNKMVSEEGWHPEQVVSAITALEAILDE
jgi:NADH:ubiquinone oxidoreductase subunit E